MKTSEEGDQGRHFKPPPSLEVARHGTPKGPHQKESKGGNFQEKKQRSKAQLTFNGRRVSRVLRLMELWGLTKNSEKKYTGGPRRDEGM